MHGMVAVRVSLHIGVVDKLAVGAPEFERRRENDVCLPRVRTRVFNVLSDD